MQDTEPVCIAPFEVRSEVSFEWMDCPREQRGRFVTGYWRPKREAE